MNPIDDFLTTLTSPRTAERYRAALEEFTAWYRQTNGTEPDWKLLTPVEVKDYIAYLQTVRRLSPASVNLRLAAIRSLLKYLGRSLRVKGPNQVLPPVRALTPRELGRLLAAAEGSPRDTAMLNLMARAGLRVGEVVRLLLTDVELNGRSGWLTIRHQFSNLLDMDRQIWDTDVSGAYRSDCCHLYGQEVMSKMDSSYQRSAAASLLFVG